MADSSYTDNPLQMPVRFVKGVGPKVADLLAARGIATAGDLLYHIPSRYLDRRQVVTIASIEPGQDYSIMGEILASGMGFAGRGRRRFEAALSDGSGVLRLKWFRFNTKYVQSAYRKGATLLVSGKVTEFRGELQMIHPTVEIMEGEAMMSPEAPGIVALYPSVSQLGQRYLSKVIRNALELCLPHLQDPLPRSFRERHHLQGLVEALEYLHRPPDDADTGELHGGRSLAHRRMIFEELFFLELGLALKRKGLEREQGIAIQIPSSYRHDLLGELPFKLTGAQSRVLEVSLRDMSQATPMNRLIQGDVGSGKTVVALLAARAAVKAGYQVAVMAPTEILAEQHFRSFRNLLGNDASQAALLTASLRAKEKKWLRLCLQEGRIPIVIGTHALLSEEVHFKRLGLVVIDEQHRFGVMQRKALKQKACSEGAPDVLVMTATPIPRTLAMTVYGELDVSVIDELPPGRQAIETRIVGERQRRQMYRGLERIMERGEQIFIVYPLVEETEKSDLKAATEMAQHLQDDIFPQFSVGLLHGRLSADEKEATMRAFKEHDHHILVATTVVEVGIDVPNATCIVIEHPERFGLSQLHQLRGRIGRGDKASLCILMSSSKQTDDAKRRMKVMEATTDGFRIAEEDLKIRGPGEFLGTRQSGLPDLRFANLVRDVPILSEAREAAFQIIAEDPNLFELPTFRAVIKERWQEKLELADVG